MTDDDRRRDPADDDEIADSLDADSLDIDDAPAKFPAGQSPPGHPSSVDPPPGDGLASDPPVATGASVGSGAPPSDPAAGEVPMTKPSRREKRASKAREKSRKPRRKAPWWELPALVALAIVIAIVVKSFLVQPFYIPSESMEKTLHGCPGCSGDRILVSKIIYDFRDPHPGDIVVFNAPSGWDEEPASIPPSNPILRAIRGFGQLIGFVPPDGLVLVKRVIAMGGQTVKGDRSGNVFISTHGKAGPWRELKEAFVYETGADPRAAFGPITVPKGRLWVMGDHRDRSADSRYHCGGAGTDGPDNSTCNVISATVPISAVIGKAFVIAWPPSRWTTLGTPKTFTTAAAGITGSGAIPLFIVLPLFVVIRRRKHR